MWKSYPLFLHKNHFVEKCGKLKETAVFRSDTKYSDVDCGKLCNFFIKIVEKQCYHMFKSIKG